MKILKRLFPFPIFIALTPLILVFAVGSSVDGNWFYMKLVFPYTVLLVIFAREISMQLYSEVFWIFWVGLSAIQLPLYGAAINRSEKRENATAALLMIHLLFVVLAFVLGYALGVP